MKGDWNFSLDGLDDDSEKKKSNSASISSSLNVLDEEIKAMGDVLPTNKKENISNDNVKDEDWKQAVSRSRRVQAQAYAFLERAVNAGIPPKYMRIKADTLRPILFAQSKSKKEELLHNIYKNPPFLMNREWIVIEGGDIEERKTLGFALLFRMIAYDYYGTYEECSEIVHTTKTAKNSNDEWKGEAVNRLKKTDVLFISEVAEGMFHPSWDTGYYFDEILSHRTGYMLPTIVSLSKRFTTDTDVAGQYFLTLNKKLKGNVADPNILKLSVTTNFGL